MLFKEVSNSKKAGWKEYKERTWLLFPKFFKSSLVSIAFYAVVYWAFRSIYMNGGIEATVQKWRA
jgi:hypothetical protein